MSSFALSADRPAQLKHTERQIDAETMCGFATSENRQSVGVGARTLERVARPWPETPPTAEERAAYADATVGSFWLDDLPRRTPSAPLQGAADADLAIVGGGFTGLWAALHAKADDPSRDVVLLERDVVAGAASGRNGGFCVSSLTHGISNGRSRFPEEIALLERVARENYDGLVADLERHGIDAALEETGELIVGLEPHTLAWLAEEAELAREHGHEVELLDAEAVRAEVHSPTYVGGLWDRRRAAIVHPARLADGLRAAALRAGVRIHEHSAVTGLTQDRAGAVTLTVGGGAGPGRGATGHATGAAGGGAGTVRAERVVLATGAHPSLLSPVRRRIAPVYDYALVTEPLTAEQLTAIGWRNRQGIGDAANQFHYYRLTPDNRILWGGYDAVHHFGGAVDARYDAREATFAKLSQHFFTTFPQLRGLRFTHRWGGAIDTCTRFSVFFTTSHGGRVSSATGYTGLGVCATRFGARVALDLVDGRKTDATTSRYVRSQPFPFPPEPLRTAAIRTTQRYLERADASEGQRGPFLRVLDRLGLGFDT